MAIWRSKGPSFACEFEFVLTNLGTQGAAEFARHFGQKPDHALNENIIAQPASERLPD